MWLKKRKIWNTEIKLALLWGRGVKHSFEDELERVAAHLENGQPVCGGDGQGVCKCLLPPICKACIP